MYLPSTVEALPALIHLSLFLFFAGLAVFLFNINHDVFISVVWWIVGFTAAYGWMTVMPIFRHNSPYYSPLSSTAWTLHAVVSYTLCRVLAFITSGYGSFRLLSDHYHDRISSHVQKVAEDTALKQPSRLDLEILDCTIGDALGDDESLEEFFEAIPGFFESPLVENDLKGFLHDKLDVRSKIVESLEGFMERNLSSNEINIRRLIICMNATKGIGESGDIYRILSGLSQGTLGEDDNLLEKLFDIILDFFKLIPEEDPERYMTDYRLWHALDGLLCRTLPANTVTESVKTRRLDVYLNAIKVIYGHEDVDYALFDILGGEFGQLPASMDIAYTLSHWCAARKDIPHMVKIAPTWVADTLIHAPTRKRDKDWIAFVKHQFDSPEDVLSEDALQEYIRLDNNCVLLAIFNHVARQVIRTGSWGWDMDILSPLSKFDIRDSDERPELQNEFCALWNQIVQKARDEDPDYCLYLLRWIRQLYIALHQGTDAAPTAFDASTKDKNNILSRPSSYPLCNIDGHHPHSAVPRPTQPIPGSSAAPQQAEEAHIISELLALPGQESSSPSSKSNPVHGPPQATVPSIHEFMQTFGPDLNRLVSNLSMLVSLLSDQSSLSSANLTTKFGRNDEPTPDIGIKVQSSQTPTATLLTGTFHQHPQVDPVPVTVTPSIIAHPPSVSVEQQGEFSDTPQPIASDLTFFHFLDAHQRQDTTVSQAGSDVTLVSSNATQIHPSISIASVTLQTSEGLTGVPPTTVSDPQSSLIVALPTTSSVIPTEPPPSVESTVVQLDPLSHPFGSLPSTLTTAHSHIASQVPGPSVLDVPVTRSIGGLGSHGQHETCDPNPPAPTEASLRVQQTGSSTREAREA